MKEIIFQWTTNCGGTCCSEVPESITQAYRLGSFAGGVSKRPRMRKKVLNRCLMRLSVWSLPQICWELRRKKESWPTSKPFEKRIRKRDGSNLAGWPNSVFHPR